MTEYVSGFMDTAFSRMPLQPVKYTRMNASGTYSRQGEAEGITPGHAQRLIGSNE